MTVCMVISVRRGRGPERLDNPSKYTGGLTQELQFLDVVVAKPAPSRCVPNHLPGMICKSHHVDDTHH